ncbi:MULTISPECIES: TetR/AcrR family transcriptional regulator [unclassified Amycolatopsis]|uniref:TetR/AcrR family transcriptional regulator n=1 Tax=unclassified Amycolatopsis TaxID=2618356 RepID=UPI003454D377
MNSESPRAGRPLGFDRREALNSLMTLFWHVGFDGVTQQQMAAATGLSTSSLYNSFGTKIEIYREAVDEYLVLMQDVLAPLQQGERGSEDVLEALSRLESVLDGPNAGFGCLATTAMAKPVDEHVATATRRYREQLRAGFLAALERGRELGESTADPAVLADLLTATVLGTLTIARADPDGRELAAQLKSLRAFVENWRA